MVKSITNLTRNGLSDWLLQRVSAVMMLVYTVFLLFFLCLHPNLQYLEWKALFVTPFMKIVSVLVLLSLLAHAWIGLWIVFTDYVKCIVVRLILQILVILLLLGYLIWGIMILWS